MKNTIFDIVVVGSGPAGMTAAIYGKRSGMNVVILENSAPGGQVNRTAHIENYPGFTTIDGPSLSMKMFEQINNLKIEYRYGNVIEIIEKDEHKIIKTDTEEIISKAVIIATGRVPQELGVDGEKKLTGRGVSWCAVCDGPLFKGKDVIVIGGGNSAAEESLYLSDITNKVTLIHRRDKLRADILLAEKVKANKKINIIWDSIPIRFNDKDNKLVSIDIENKKTKEKKNILCDGIFIYIGFKPATQMLKNINIADDLGYIITDENMRTTQKGIYAAGDVRKKELFQIANAIGDGATAAMSAVRDINN